MNNTMTDWDHSYALERDYQWTTTSRLARVMQAAAVPAPASVLDIGCGTGQLCRDLYHRGYTVDGVDSSAEAIKLAKNSTVISNGISFTVSDAMDFRPDHDLYDLVLCKYTLAFMRDMLKSLEHIKTLLNPKGVLVIINPDIESLPANKRTITVEHEFLLHILDGVFKSVESELIGNEYYYYATNTNEGALS